MFSKVVRVFVRSFLLRCIVNMLSSSSSGSCGSSPPPLQLPDIGGSMRWAGALVCASMTTSVMTCMQTSCKKHAKPLRNIILCCADSASIVAWMIAQCVASKACGTYCSRSSPGPLSLIANRLRQVNRFADCVSCACCDGELGHLGLPALLRLGIGQHHLCEPFLP